MAQPSCVAITLWSLIVAVALVPPVMYALNRFSVVSFSLPVYSYLVYIVIANTLILKISTGYLTAALAYPFSNHYFRTTEKKESASSFSLEYLHCMQTLVTTIRDVLEQGG